MSYGNAESFLITKTGHKSKKWIGIVEKKLEDLLYEIKGWEDKIKRNEERVCIYTCIIIRRSDV
jgi:hypothetical protein